MGRESRNALIELQEVEYIMNARFAGQLYDGLEELIQKLIDIPRTSAVFEIRDKDEWINELKVESDKIRNVQLELSRKYFGSLKL